MSHKKSRSRSVGLILIGLMLGAVTISPAFANHTPKHTKKQIKKVKKALNKKIKKVNNTVKTLPTTSAVQSSIDASLDERINILGDSWVKATATPGADEPTARAAAPKIPLFTMAPFTFYGKCFSYPTDNVWAEIMVETTVDGAILNGFDTSDGDPLLNTTTPEDERRLESTSTGADDASLSEQEFIVMAPGGIALNGLVSAAAKEGTLPGGNGIYGDGDVCLFSGFAAGN